jgi:predicted DNA binding CopG/RHH family protein
MPKKKLSETRGEAEEARWFEENQERLLKLFEQAEKEGSLRVGGKSVGITLSKKTAADRARSQAARKGIGYQTYIRSCCGKAWIVRVVSGSAHSWCSLFVALIPLYDA